MKKPAALVLFIVLIGFAASIPTAAQTATSDGHWVSAWGSSVLEPVHLPGVPPEPPIADKTIRMVIRPTVGGRRVRVRLSNEFGTSALVVRAAHIALTDEGSRIKPETDRVLTFGGQANVGIPAGAPMLSDPVDLQVKAFSEVSISIYLPSNTPVSSWHFQAQHGSYLAGPGDLTAKSDLSESSHKAAWYFLSGLEVWTTRPTTTIVAFGDSITQGTSITSSKPEESYTDWPYQLARRLSAESAVPAIAVVNEGIGGNRVLHDGAGVSALARFDRDVLAQPGVTTLILLAGINDIGFPRIRIAELKIPALKENPFAAERVSAEEIVAGLQQIAVRAHEHGIRVFGGTVTPFEGTNSFDADGETVRQDVNKWIRTTKVFDGIFDFDALMRDPVRPSRLRDLYDSGDHVHPNPAGYKAMADSISLAVLKGQSP